MTSAMPILKNGVNVWIFLTHAFWEMLALASSYTSLAWQM
jgi:hypothetical protein